MQEIEQMLRETMGLDAASVGSNAIQRSVRQRMRRLGIRKTEAYREMLISSEAEWSELVEGVIVAETWFFRDREPFLAVAQMALREWLPVNPERSLRLLSVPCSSGEEPYSMAMALLDAGVPPGRFQVEGVDISAHSLARAERAVYGSNSFRGQDLAFRDRYFERTREGFELNTLVRGCVRFSQGNLLAANFLPGRAPYDYVFCRNLLIYFDRATQGKTLETIRSRLAPAGVLFTGAAEQTLTLEHGFVSAKIPMAFACRHAAAQPPRADRRTRSSQPVGWLVTEAPHRSGAVVPAPAGASSGIRAAPDGGSSLEQARRLADAGRLKEAAELCDAHLLKHGASAEAYYLLGLVRDAASDESALDCYRKALYLEPGHYESLLHMALSCQKHGYPDRARTFRNRAERVKNRSAGRA